MLVVSLIANSIDIIEPSVYSRNHNKARPFRADAGQPGGAISGYGDNVEDTRQYDCDVLVVGSGASGMAAAITAASAGLKVLIIEKEPRFGGSTARSGGWLWIPGTALARVQGIHETPDEARAYLRHEAGDSYNGERVDAFLAHGPEAVDFFTANTEVQFDMPLVFPDYHAEAAGGKQGGRSMVARPYDGRKLGAHVKDLAPALPELTVFGMMLGSGKEIVHFMRATRSLASAWYVAKRLSRHFLDVLKHGRGMTLTNGNALAGRLAASAFKLGIPLWLNAPAKSLIIEDGVVKGAVVQRDGASVRVRRARRGAGGGRLSLRYRAAQAALRPRAHRRRALFAVALGQYRRRPAPGRERGRQREHQPAQRRGLGAGVGGHAQGRQSRLHAALHRPRQARRHRRHAQRPPLHQRGRVVSRLRAGHGARLPDGGEICAWLVCDHKTLRKYGLGSAAPFPMPIKRYLRTGYLLRGSSVAELAQRAGIDAGSLRQTVEAFNAEARLGRDPLHGKGSKAYNRYQGDALHGPNPAWRPSNRDRTTRSRS